MRPPTPLPSRPISIPSPSPYAAPSPSPSPSTSSSTPSSFSTTRSLPRSLLSQTPLSTSPLSSPPRPSPPFPQSQGHPSPPREPTATPSSFPSERRSSPLVGSWSSSLLSMRMPDAPLTVFPSFSARLRLPPLPLSTAQPLSSHGPSAPRQARLLTAPFRATFYSLSSPYVGTILLPSPHPLPVKGSVQLLLLNPEEQPLRAFLVPYDARSLRPGERTYVRQMCYAPSPASPSSSPSSDAPVESLTGKSQKEKPKPKGVLRYAVQFCISCSPLEDDPLPFDMELDLPSPSPSPSASSSGARRRRRSTSRPPKPAKHVYLSPSVRVVFASRTGDEDGPLRVETELEGSASFPAAAALPLPLPLPALPTSPKSPTKRANSNSKRPSSPFPLPLSPRLGPTLGISTDTAVSPPSSRAATPTQASGAELTPRLRGLGALGLVRALEPGSTSTGQDLELERDWSGEERGRSRSRERSPLAERDGQQEPMGVGRIPVLGELSTASGVELGWDGRASRVAYGPGPAHGERRWADEAVIR
ncbi:hypothetical protein CALVIDRAFT_7526 [Calocera viscosa TUFC12733]|uniref:Atos-like C-terminal domain-containing protein n=1 Tax=Calocera viscosa (strain TUFC12733) TaxID=1330018 RepID=A0A167S1U6_CALVF|nr:hypothetical protein CALVIDRAFT_7526 [Calocera viscosa TUFC12733]